MKRFGVLALGAVLFVVIGATAFVPLAVGNLGANQNPAIAAQLGVRFQSTVQGHIKPGQTFNAVIVDENKLKGLGYRHVKKNDMVVIKVLENNRFQVIGPRPEPHTLRLGQQGAISRER